MKSIKAIVTSALIFVMFNCNEDIGIFPKDYAYVLTEDAINITENSVTFGGNILSVENFTIIESGFVWDTIPEPVLGKSYKRISSMPLNMGKYYETVDHDLYPKIDHYVRAYLKTKELVIVYGNSVKFQCNGGQAPIIDSITPMSGYVKSNVTVYGENFSTIKNNNIVTINGIKIFIDSCSENKIHFQIPDLDSDIEAKIKIDVNGKKVESSEKFRAFTYWRQIAAFPGEARFDAAFFTVNGKGYVGGGDDFNGGQHKDFWEYDHVLNLWTRKADYPGKLKAGRIGFSVNNIGYIGFGQFSIADQVSDLWQYNYSVDQWKEISCTSIGTMDNTNFCIGNIVYYLYNSISGYNIETNQCILGCIVDFVPMYSTATSMNGKGYVIARSRATSSISYLWEFTPEDISWKQLAAIPGAFIYDMTLFSIKNQLFAGLGISNNTGQISFYAYNNINDQWIRIENFPGGARKSAVCFVIGNKAYIGTGKNNNSLIDFFEFDPFKI